ncbi:putative invertase inhibitor [Typha angustifolia]|uniref:putative invertase inhibitor n=1 Tax=Typha angustifolia TaxID=59011 RepID=UPI003C303C45
MGSSLFLPFFVLALLHHNLLLSVLASVEDACKAVTIKNQNVGYNFCVTSLQADPNSGSTDSKGLAIIAANLTKVNATITAAKIQSLLKEPLDPVAKALLNTCTNIYENIIDLLSSSIDALRAGRVAEAKEKLMLAENKPEDCDDLLFEGGKNSLLAKEDEDCQGLVTITQTFASMLA